LPSDGDAAIRFQLALLQRSFSLHRTRLHVTVSRELKGRWL
jgi:hypothetical protein